MTVTKSLQLALYFKPLLKKNKAPDPFLTEHTRKHIVHVLHALRSWCSCQISLIQRNNAKIDNRDDCITNHNCYDIWAYITKCCSVRCLVKLKTVSIKEKRFLKYQ